MSRVAKKPVALPKGVTVTFEERTLKVKGPKGELVREIHPSVNLEVKETSVEFSPALEDQKAVAMAGTMRALTNNMVIGVSEGFQRKLELVGVGYRANAQGSLLNLTLGFSHPVQYTVPQGISIETPTQTEILVRGSDKQVLGQVCADIRSYRPPEPYKGKGIRYSDERVVRKEAKKK
jgi:large subunit ribosomal protein L6